MSIQEQIETLRTQRAAQWLEIMHSGAAEQNAEFLRWITESPRNLEEFLKLEALSRETRATLQSGALDRNALLENSRKQVLQFAPTASATVQRDSRRLAPGRLSGIAAAVAAVAIAALGYNHYFGWKEFTTDAEQRTVELSDGSLIYLNAASTLSARMGLSTRDLKLSRGEALFNVAHDRQRPFKVHTRDAIVEAVGTQFNVRTQASGTQVAVLEGKVRIRSEADTQSAASAVTDVPLGAGEAATVAPVGAIERNHQADIATLTAWNRPELVFERTPLESAVEQFNHHRLSKPLRLDGVPRRSHHYTGIFNATDATSFAELLAREPDLQVLIGEREIVIRGR
ncbi:FecR family protein [Steroidobacter sp.]|uniref:FecR family protein n=1 Tax=Steroidobacter sp. TaxID=1978227 RepID=UPI001A5AF25E|nr:FecR domain-containing protein [Steroidobacter sp.]MBL8269049.1 FecR domain-containing protein [Steroidobacter sp.]